MSNLTIRALPDEKAHNLARRLKSRAPELACRVCGHRDFAMLEDPDSNFRTLLRREQVSTHPLYDKSYQKPITQRLLTLVCTHCGHLEQFAEAVLDGATPEQYGAEVIDD